MLFEHRLLFGEFCDALEAGDDDKHLLLLFRIGNHFAQGADFFRMLEPEADIAQYRGHLLTTPETCLG